MAKKWAVSIWLVGLVSLGFLVLLGSQQYLHDDMTMLHFNIDLFTLHTLSDCLFFVLQKTKPVTNVVYALANWALGFSVLGNHFVSLAIHLAVVLLWYANLQRWVDREGKSSWLAILAASWFAIAPIHSETIGIAQFRGELLASFFTLAAWYLAPTVIQKQSVSRLALLLICLSLAALSKEIFLVIAVAVVAWEWMSLKNLSLEERSMRFHSLFSLTLVGIGLWTALYRLYLSDFQGPYTYTYNVGFKYDNHAEWIIATGRAFLEGIWKLFSGRDLTTVRMANRGGLGASLAWPTHLAILLAYAVALGAAFLKLRRYRGFVLALSLGTLLYLTIPNANSGSEHYWYFASAPAFFLAVCGLEKLIPTRWAWVSVGSLFLVFQFSALQIRLLDYQTRRTFVAADLRAHPESWWPWINWALVQAEEQKPQAVIDAIFEYSEHLGSNEYLVVHRLVAALLSKNSFLIDRYLNESYRAGFRGRGLSNLFTRASLILNRQNDRIRSLAAARTAVTLYPANEAAKRWLNAMEKSIVLNPPIQNFLTEVPPTTEHHG